MKKYQLVSLLWLLSSMNGQNLVDLRTQTKNVDFSGAASTIPAKSGTTLPTTCNPGEMFFDTANTPGQNLYTCAPANTWTQLNGSAGSTNGTVSSATAGQFGFYAANGSTVVGHTLAPGDIPALSYQSLLTFTGSGSKTASSTGSLVSGNCAKWDASGNIIDFGSPCANVASGTPGQFAFYSALGSALTPHTLAASDIPALNYQAPLSFTGSGTKTASSTGTFTSNDCAKWDANGNVIDSGAPCATGSANVGTGITGQFAFYSANGSALSAHTLAASDIPALSYQSLLTFTGNGTKTASSTGAFTSNDCAKWDANGNVIDSGAPCATGSANIATGTAGQFAFYSANGSALSAHTLAPSDIPALSYQALLTFTGTGAKTASSTGSLLAGDCAKWDSNGNIIDFGSPCANVSSGATGQFAFYSANGSALSAHTLLPSDIPALSYQAPLSFTGNGTKTASSTGAFTSNDCAKWDANGNVIDSGAPCATGSANIGTGTAGQFGFYSANGSALSAHTLAASDIPALSYQAPLTFTGNGTKTASSTGAFTSNDCAKWDANGNVIDSGAPCATGSANIGTGSAGQFAFYSANGSALSAHTLAPSDIPALTYQAPLTFTGSGTKTASSTGAFTSNDCAKWDANGNVIDSGAPCATGSANIGTGSAGQFAFYSANGSALSAHTLAPSDIPALGYQSPLLFTGTGTKTASSSGSLVAGDCAKWDPNGNIIDFGSPCASVSSGATGQFAFYSANGSALSPHTLAASDIPVLSYQAPLAFTGNGTKTASSTGTFTSNDCAKWDANGNVIDSGAPCATGSANIGAGTVGQFAFYSANGSALSAHSLAVSDIPALNYQAPLSFTGSGAKTASSTGGLTVNNCAKWDAAGNVVDSGSPCLSAGLGTPGQFAIYAGNGSALLAHSLASSDIPALNYQAPLSFTGNGAKTASSAGTLTSNDCAKWDANGNAIDAGSPCASVASGTTGQFAFYSANGSALAAHTLAAIDIPALNYQAPLSFTGNGAKTASSTGTLTSNDCAKWDANGNAIDAGSPCASVASGTTGQFAFYSANGSALAAHTLAAIDIPALNYQAPLSFTGSGAKTASSTGSVTATHCAMWDANGNVVDAGAACGSGSGGGGISAPSSTTVGNVPQFSNTTGTALSAGLGVVTSVGAPGSDTNIPTEKSVRTAIAAVVTAAGNLPAQTGNAGYLSTNGSVASWGNIATGASGALDCATVPGVCDIVTAIVPLKPAANAWTGANDFSGAAFLRIATGAGIPATGCSAASNVGSVYMRNDTQATGASLYVCSQTGNGAYSWELAQTSGAPLPVYTSGGTALSDHIVTGRNSFFSSSATVGLSGSAAFSTATSYACTANDLSSAAAVRVTQTSGSSVTFSITGGGSTDNFSYNCVGN